MHSIGYRCQIRTSTDSPFCRVRWEWNSRAWESLPSLYQEVEIFATSLSEGAALAHLSNLSPCQIVTGDISQAESQGSNKPCQLCCMDRIIGGEEVKGWSQGIKRIAIQGVMCSRDPDCSIWDFHKHAGEAGSNSCLWMFSYFPCVVSLQIIWCNWYKWGGKNSSKRCGPPKWKNTTVFQNLPALSMDRCALIYCYLSCCIKILGFQLINKGTLHKSGVEAGALSYLWFWNLHLLDPLDFLLRLFLAPEWSQEFHPSRL